jgi:hypothetical protein
MNWNGYAFAWSDCGKPQPGQLVSLLIFEPETLEHKSEELPLDPSVLGYLK